MESRRRFPEKHRTAYNRTRAWFHSLQDGTLKFALVLLAATAVLLILGILLDAPGLAGLVVPLLIVPAMRAKTQNERSRDAALRTSGAVRTSSVLDHPRFSAGFVTGLRNMGRRLWTPRWIPYAIDYTSDHLRFLPIGMSSAFGFETFSIAWAELDRAVRSRNPLHQGNDWGYLTLEGTFGPPLQVSVNPFSEARKQFDLRRIPIV